MSRPPSRWTPEQWNKACELYNDGLDRFAIGDAIGKSAWAVAHQFIKHGRKAPPKTKKVIRADKGLAALNSEATQHLFAVAAERANARRDLTGFICGDPPQGFSALDQKRLRESQSVASLRRV